MKIIITGASGMVGEGVLKHCLESEAVTAILAINRRNLDLSHPKLQQLIIKDFNNLGTSIQGFDACFYCAGISSVGKKEPEYTQITYDTTLNFAKALLEVNPNIIFNYVSGAHTHIQGKQMWQRVKGKTEAALMQMDFTTQYNFRPGFMKPVKGQKNVPWFFKPVVAIFPLIAPSQSLTLHEVAAAMIQTMLLPPQKTILEIADIKRLAHL